MNFFEAMKALDEGKKLLSPEKFIYKKINGEVRAWSELLNGWKKVVNLDEAELYREWKIYNEPKEGKGLWKTCDCCDSSIVTLTTSRRFEDKNQKKIWEDALETFMQLKGHILAIVPTEAEKEYFLYFDISNDSVDIESLMFCDAKGCYLSPTFASVESAKQALEDIGKENLIKMAKVFQGIYE